MAVQGGGRGHADSMRGDGKSQSKPEPILQPLLYDLTHKTAKVPAVLARQDP